MRCELKIYGSLCATETFAINGIKADDEDFGSQWTTGDGDYGCADCQWTADPATDEVLAKYSITLAEYNEICEKLQEGLSFGSCGWCS